MPSAPLSLYIDLEKGRVAELEAVATASLEFAAVIREIAAFVDPTFEFRLELENGAEGSLRLNALIRWIRGLYFANPTLFSVVAGAASWFAAQTGSYTYDKFLDYLLKTDDPQVVQLRLTEEQARDIAQKVIEIQARKVGEAPARRVFAALSRDSAVTGVGVATSHKSAPLAVVPRSEFEARSTAPTELDVVEDHRETPERGLFVITRPVLKEGSGRWRLRGARGEFSATIEDQDFLDQVVEGKINAPMAAGVIMDADILVEEDKIADLWKPSSYRVVKVYTVERRPGQITLPPTTSQHEGGTAAKGEDR